LISRLLSGKLIPRDRVATEKLRILQLKSNLKWADEATEKLVKRGVIRQEPP
jgi:hypothetical protein